MTTNPQQNAVKKTITKEEWQKKLNQVKVEKADLNKLVMNYLMIEGYKDAAEKFAQEANLNPQHFDMTAIEDRMVIRNAIQNGYIDEAIEKVNDLDPEILDTNPKLYFHLQQQKLIEFIRIGKISEAIEFAQEELAPRGEENPEFLEELEKTMSLLVFSPSPTSQSLLDHSQRQKIASEVNSAILVSQCEEKEPKLPGLIKVCKWSQGKLDDLGVEYPKIVDFKTGELVDEKKWK